MSIFALIQLEKMYSFIIFNSSIYEPIRDRNYSQKGS